MFSQYFGSYLLEQDMLTPNELRHVLNKKNGIYMKLGTLGIQRKYLTPEQVEYIHRLQANSTLKFGELAVVHGFLSEEQVRELVKLQKNELYLISQVLIEENFFTQSQITTILDNYRAELGLSKYEFEGLKNNDIEKTVEVFTKLNELCDSNILSDYVSLFVKNLIRFIDNEIKVGEAEVIDEYDYRWLIFQNMGGETDMFTGYASDDDGMYELGCRFSKKAQNGINDYVLSSAGEFMNLQNGLFLSRLSEEGMEPDLHVQEWRSGGRLISCGGLIKIPVRLSFSGLDLFISEKIPQLSDKEEITAPLSARRGK